MNRAHVSMAIAIGLMTGRTCSDGPGRRDNAARGDASSARGGTGTSPR